MIIYHIIIPHLKHPVTLCVACPLRQQCQCNLSEAVTSDLRCNPRPHLVSRWKIASQRVHRQCVYTCVCVFSFNVCLLISLYIIQPRFVNGIFCLVLSIKGIKEIHNAHTHTYNIKVPAVLPHYFNIDKVMLRYRGNQVLQTQVRKTREEAHRERSLWFTSNPVI